MGRRTVYFPPPGTTYHSAEEEYVTGPPVTCEVIGRRLGVHPVSVERWCRVGKWFEKRRAAQAERERQASAAAAQATAQTAAKNAAEIAKLREEVPLQHSKVASAVVTIIARRLKAELDSPGTLSHADVQKLTAALNNAVAVNREALGLTRETAPSTAVTPEDIAGRMRELFCTSDNGQSKDTKDTKDKASIAAANGGGTPEVEGAPAFTEEPFFPAGGKPLPPS